ncbi:MAG: hypothetical protein M3319_00095, partial [Actinomycetota bacterium]|nr:hypothetical protein [Actinomycetota bacterium]
QLVTHRDAGHGQGNVRTGAVDTLDGGELGGLVAVLVVYVVMTIGTVYVLRRMASYHRLGAPQEADAGVGGAR